MVGREGERERTDSIEARQRCHFVCLAYWSVGGHLPGLRRIRTPMWRITLALATLAGWFLRPVSQWGRLIANSERSEPRCASSKSILSLAIRFDPTLARLIRRSLPERFCALAVIFCDVDGVVAHASVPRILAVARRYRLHGVRAVSRYHEHREGSPNLRWCAFEFKALASFTSNAFSDR